MYINLHIVTPEEIRYVRPQVAPNELGQGGSTARQVLTKFCYVGPNMLEEWMAPMLHQFSALCALAAAWSASCVVHSVRPQKRASDFGLLVSCSQTVFCVHGFYCFLCILFDGKAVHVLPTDNYIAVPAVLYRKWLYVIGA